MVETLVWGVGGQCHGMTMTFDLAVMTLSLKIFFRAISQKPRWSKMVEGAES